MENHKESVRQELIRLFEQKGGYKKVAQATGLNNQRLYYIQTGRNAATELVIKKIIDCYPDDTKTIQDLTGLSPEIKQSVTIDTKAAESLIELQAENKSLKDQLKTTKETVEFLKDMIEELRIEKSALFAQLFPMDPDDPNSANLGRRIREQVRVGKAWASDIATDLSEAEILERNKIGFDYTGKPAPAEKESVRQSGFLSIVRGTGMFSSGQTESLATA